MPSFDVLILGAGSIGLPTSLEMAKNGLKVLVIDKNASPGQGSDKAAIGGVRATHSDPAKIALGRRSLQIFSSWKELHGQEIEWNSGGYTYVAYGEKEKESLQTLLSFQQNRGLNISWQNRQSFLKIIPDLNPRGLLGGTYSPEDGHCSTLLASQAFYEAAKEAGAVFHFRERVLSLLTEGGQVTGVKTDKGNYFAAVVINAAGAWANEIRGLSHPRFPVYPESHEAGITEPVESFLSPMVVDIRKAKGSANYYFYQIKSGQVIFCITPYPPLAGFDTRETSTFLPLVARRLINLIPRLTNIRVRRTWRGLYPMTPDGNPLVGWVNGYTGYLLAGGMCGQGFMLGPGIAELLFRMVSMKELPVADKRILEDISPYREFIQEEALK